VNREPQAVPGSHPRWPPPQVTINLGNLDPDVILKPSLIRYSGDPIQCIRRSHGARQPVYALVSPLLIAAASYLPYSSSRWFVDCADETRELPALPSSLCRSQSLLGPCAALSHQWEALCPSQPWNVCLQSPISLLSSGLLDVPCLGALRWSAGHGKWWYAVPLTWLHWRWWIWLTVSTDLEASITLTDSKDNNQYHNASIIPLLVNGILVALYEVCSNQIALCLC
jgi:hypothetical protein